MLKRSALHDIIKGAGADSQARDKAAPSPTKMGYLLAQYNTATAACLVNKGLIGVPELLCSLEDGIYCTLFRSSLLAVCLPACLPAL